eukprot:gene2569-5012_t
MSKNTKIPGEINYRSPEYILQNLAFVKDCFADVSHTLSARNATFEVIGYQICFYCKCALRALVGREIAPSILVCGAGELGSHVIEMLIDCGCGPFLKIYARGDVDVRKWRRRGLASSTSISDLVLGHNPDIVILCINLTSFPQLGKTLLEYMSSTVFVISATFGLTLKRIYHMLKTPGVFRINTEPASMYRRIKAVNKDPLTAIENATLANALKVHDRNESISENLQYAYASPIEYAADLLVSSSVEVKNMIRILENYYGILGMSHTMAREEAIISILGNDNNINNTTNNINNNGTNGVEGGGGTYISTHMSTLTGGSSIASSSDVFPIALQTDSFDSTYESTNNTINDNDDDDTPSNNNRSTLFSISESFSPIPAKIAAKDQVPSLKSLIGLTTNTHASFAAIAPTPKSKPFLLLDSVLKLLRDKVGIRFQMQLSKRIKIVDLPAVDSNRKVIPTDEVIPGGRRSSLYAKKIRKKGKFAYLELALSIQNRGNANPLLDETELIALLESDMSEVDEFVQQAHIKERDGIELENPLHKLEYSNFKLINTEQGGLASSHQKMFNDDFDDEKDDFMEALESWVTISEQTMLDKIKEEQKQIDPDGDELEFDSQRSSISRSSGLHVRFPEAATEYNMSDLDENSIDG